MLPVLLQLPVAGLYNSALFKLGPPVVCSVGVPPTTSTLPLGSSVAL
jgi:hypothetical protein